MTILECIEAVRRARAWAAAAPRYAGEFAFGSSGADPVVFGVFGDSLGCGVGASGLSRCMAGVVAARLAQEFPVLCRIAAISGTQAPELARQRVVGDERLVAVSIGTNDLLHCPSLKRFELALENFLSRLKHAERVVVLGPGDMEAVAIFPEALHPMLRWRRQAWEAAMAAVVSRFENAAYLGPSTLGVKLAREHFAEDGFHPGDLGQEVIAGGVYRLLSTRADEPARMRA